MTAADAELLRIADPRSGARLCEAQQAAPHRAPSLYK
jgi:hypothetical protein